MTADLAADLPPWPESPRKSGSYEQMHSPAALAGTCKEWRYRQPAVALITQGSFGYRTVKGQACAVAGAIITGNASEVFEAQHDGRDGNSRIVLFLDEMMMMDIAAKDGLADPSFSASVLAPGKSAVLPSAWIKRLVDDPSADDALPFLLASMLMAPQRQPGPRRSLQAEHAMRIHDTIRYVHNDPGALCSLERLAQIARMSRYQFLRRFGQMVGTTPGQYVLCVRMRAAAHRLAVSKDPIVNIALDSGFDDLSTFYRQFSDRFGMTPAQWRRRS